MAAGFVRNGRAEKDGESRDRAPSSPRNHPQERLVCPRYFPASSACVGRAVGQGQAPLSYFQVQSDSPSDTRNAPGPAPLPFALSPPLSLTHHHHRSPPIKHGRPARPTPSTTKPGGDGRGPRHRLPHAHWRGSLVPLPHWAVQPATPRRGLLLRASSSCFEKTYKQIPGGRPLWPVAGAGTGRGGG